MNEMTVTVRGTRKLAENACLMVFGEDAGAGPVCPTPTPLLAALENWPKDKLDQAIEIALEMPMDFDIAKEMPRGHVRAVTLRACRVTVLHAGQRVGYALRTNQLGLNAIETWNTTWGVHLRRIRQAH